MEINPILFWNLILTLVIAPAFWTFRGLIAEVKRIDILLNKTREEYASRDDVKEEMKIVHEAMHRIEDKLDKLADAMVAMARAEEKLEALQNEHNKMYERVNRLSAKLDDIESGVQENSNTVKVINKLFWVAIIAASGAIAANIWM